MQEDKLYKIKQGEKKILEIFDRFCKENGLNYSLFAGTALGAVRHKGFIPWDDDIDVCMTREEFEKFYEIWGEREVEGCYMQSKRHPEYPLNHEKIRSTVSELKDIFIDIFPLDKLPIKKSLRKKMLFKAKLRLIYTRNYPYKAGGKILELASRMLLSLPKKTKKKIKKSCDAYVTKYKDMEKDFEYICLTCPDDLRYKYPQTIMRDLQPISFEGDDFTISSEYDTMLKILYGDYMVLPPENERVAKHIDFED